MSNTPRPVKKFSKTYCSDCGGEFGAGNAGYSHCDQHKGQPDISDQYISSTITWGEYITKRELQKQRRDDGLDAWECCDCGGAGRRTEYHAVTHQLGRDTLPFWETCETCEGIGFCGPDAEMRASIAKATQ